MAGKKSTGVAKTATKEKPKVASTEKKKVGRPKKS